MGTYIHLFDVEKQMFYTLPRETELEAFLGCDLTYSDASGNVFDRVECYVGEWGEDTIRVRIVLTSAVGGEIGAGWYEYDLAKQAIVEVNTDGIRETDVFD